MGLPENAAALRRGVGVLDNISVKISLQIILFMFDQVHILIIAVGG